MRPSFDAMKTEALAVLNQRWGQAVIAFALIVVAKLLMSSTSIYLRLLNLLLSGAFSLGLSNFFLRLSRKKEPNEITEVFSGFKRFTEALLASIVIDLAVVLASFVIGGLLAFYPITYIIEKLPKNLNLDNFFSLLSQLSFFEISAYSFFILLIALLFMIPGIFVSISLSQTFNVMNDNSELSFIDSLRKSNLLMKGQRIDYFLFNLSFVGWALLCIPTFGLGLLILGPYIATANAVYYNYLIAENKLTDDITETETPNTPSDFDQQFKDITSPYRNEAE